MNLAELSRRISNIARFGTVTETKSVEGKALARVKIGERVSDFLPVKSFSNSFRKHWIPTRPNEQVLVISPFGEADSGIILRGIFNKGAKEPTGANNHTEIIEYEDGTRISYDTEAKKLSVICVGDIEIEAKNITIKADNTTFIGGGINHDGIDISKTHNHPQNDGSHFGGAVDTSPPNEV